MEKYKNLTIYLVDDEPAVLQALKGSLEQIKNSKIKTFTNAQDCIDDMPRKKCSLLISDVNLGPGLDGIELLKEARKIHPNLPVLLITGYGEIPMAVRALKAGASDFIEKPIDEELLLATVNDVVEEAKQKAAATTQPLTSTEARILKCITQGQTNKEIAAEFNRSVRTVENHRSKILKKLNATSTAQLIKNAIELGITNE